MTLSGVTLQGRVNWQDWVCEDTGGGQGMYKMSGRKRGPELPLEGWLWCLCSALAVLLVSAPWGTCRTRSRKPQHPRRRLLSKPAPLRPGHLLLCEDEELKRSFPPSVLEMWRIPLLSLCAGLVSTYVVNNPMGLAWPQSTLSPPTSLGKAPLSVHQLQIRIISQHVWKEAHPANFSCCLLLLKGF